MRDDTDPGRSASGLSRSEADILRHFAGLMIPASAEYGVPGADDAAIFADILKSIGRDLAAVKRALAALNTLAGGAFTDLDTTRGETAMAAFRATGPAADVSAIGRVVLQCYYRDDRVVRALGLEPRPPFPKGHTLEQGDWTLLDAVRDRPKLWRDAP